MVPGRKFFGRSPKPCESKGAKVDGFVAKAISTVVFIIAVVFIAYTAVYMKNDGRNMMEPPKAMALTLLMVVPMAIVVFYMLSIFA